MKRIKPQILIVHGGTTFKNKKDYLKFLKTRKISPSDKKRWHGDYLQKKLGREFEILRPTMPLKENAEYADWKTHFERLFPFLRNGIILIGNSLGGIFLAKYLSENRFPKKILSIYLIAPPFDDSLPEGDLVGGFFLKSDLSLMVKNSKNLTLFFSKDDDAVPVSHAKKYGQQLPGAKIVLYKSKNGHFRISSFPELIRMLKGDLARSDS